MDIPNWVYAVQAEKTTKLKKGSQLQVKICNNCYNDHWNLEIDIPGCRFHCWVCNYGGYVKQYLRDNGIEFENEDIIIQRSAVKDSEFREIHMPENKRLWSADSKYAAQARAYLHSRGVTDDIIKRLNLRVAINDDWWGYILYPFYGLRGLEYFMGIAFLNVGLRYRFPEGTKDVYCPIMRDNGCTEIVLVEGFFDMTNVLKYTEYNIMVLLGKFVLKYQTEMLKSANYDKVYVALDGEALKDTLAIARRLNGHGVNSWVTVLPADKDPDECKDEIGRFIKESKSYSMGLDVRLRLRDA
jgi:hypothetical protein